MGKQLLFQLLKNLINSLIGGLILGLCGVAFLMSDAGIFGTIFLGLGFLLSLLYGYDNFMLKLPYVLENNKALNVIELVISFIGNFIGAMIIGHICKYTIIQYMSTSTLASILNAVNHSNHFVALANGVFSGIIIYFGVNTYKKSEQPIARFLVLLLCAAAAFYLGNSMISYSTVFYFAGGIDGSLVARLFTILLGNILGGLTIPLLIKLRRKL